MERLTRTFGQYEIVARIGRGGMAEIFLARVRGPGGFQKLVALKCIHPHLGDDEAFRTMLLDEARLAASLDHSAIVQTYAVGEVERALFIAMEYVPGQPLHRLVRKLRQNGRRLVPKLAIRIVIPIAEALAFAHERRDLKGRPLCIVHRDVSPQNVLLGYDGSVKLTDFGIAKAEGRTLDTTGDAVKGKVAYMAPEQVHAESLDGRADVFALGIVLYELLTGISPFRAQNDEPLATMRRIAEHDPPSASTYAPELTPEIDAIVDKALAKKREDRWSSAVELADELERAAHALGPATSSELAILMHDLFGEEITALETVLRGIDDPSRVARMPTLGSRPDLPAATVLTLPETRVDRKSRPGSARHDPSAPPSTLPLAPPETSPGRARASAPPRKDDTIASHGKWVNYSHEPLPPRRAGFWVTLAAAAALLAGGVVLGLSGLGLLPGAPSRAAVATAAQEPSAPIAPAAPHAAPPAETATPAAEPLPAATPTGAEAAEPLPVAPEPVRPVRSGTARRTTAGGPARDADATASPGEDARAVEGPAAVGAGRITLDSEPWAQVYLGSRLLGPTPLFEQRVPAGVLTLTLVNPPAGLQKTIRLDVPRDGLVRRRVRLRDGD